MNPLYTTVVEYNKVPWFVSYHVERNPLAIEIVEISVDGTRVDIFDYLTPGTIEQITDMVIEYEGEDPLEAYYDGIEEEGRREKKE